MEGKGGPERVSVLRLIILYNWSHMDAALKAGEARQTMQQRHGPQKRRHCLLSAEAEQLCLCSTDETRLLGASVLLAL